MAESAGPEASIFTLDLPPSEFDRSQSPANFTGSQVGSKFKGTSVASQITQLLGDSTTFDYSPYYSNIDFVFVDAAHDYMHGYADSQTALRLVRPGGLIFWHDFTSYWSGLVHGIRQATIDLPLKRLSSTTLAVLKTEE